MKKVLLSLSVLALSNWANAQTGNVGINTENPTETLNVNGTLRINELPVANGKIRTNPDGTPSATKTQNFTPTKMVVVDNNGVVGKADIPSSGAIYRGSTSISLENNNSFQRAALTGDATADKNSNTTKVVAIQGKPVSDTNPSNNQVLQWNGSKWTPASLTNYQGSTSISLENNNSFQRAALTGDATADKNSNNTKVVAIQNKPVSATAPTDNQVLQWNGRQWAPATLDIPTLPKDPQLGTGTVIAIAGEVQIAEEITATMANKDYPVSVTSGNPKEIPHLTTIIINNKNLFKATEQGNSFQVSQAGTYQIMMNVSISLSNQANESVPVIGIWNNSTNKWIARIANTMLTPPTSRFRQETSLKNTITLITVVNLEKDIIYSFRATNTHNFTIHGYNGGTTGYGPATFVSIKQLK